MRQEDVYLRRRTCRIKLSKYAAYNTYHHCEQCHQYLGFNPRYQVSQKVKKVTGLLLNVKWVMFSFLYDFNYRCVSPHCTPSH